MSPEHPLATHLAGHNPELQAFIDTYRATHHAGNDEHDKQGIDTGITVAHPFIEDRTLPLYIANFVLMDYGTGAVFGCPAHDPRDFDFAQKYNLPIRPVIAPPQGEPLPYTGDGVVCNSDFLDGMDSATAKVRVIAELQKTLRGRGATPAIACGIGASPDNAIGAVRFRLFTAKPAESSLCLRKTCP